jgi:hypothetical protein
LPYDAMSLMTAKDTIAWMKTKGYYMRWLVPKLDINVGIPHEGLPTGNSPEMISPDTSLSEDVDAGVHRHNVFT